MLLLYKNRISPHLSLAIEKMASFTHLTEASAIYLGHLFQLNLLAFYIYWIRQHFHLTVLWFRVE